MKWPWQTKDQKPPTRKRQPKTRKQVLEDAYSKVLKERPDIAKKIAFKEAGHLDLLEGEDPVKQEQREIKSRIVHSALEKIKEDPSLTERFVDAEISKIVGEAGEGTEGYSEDPFDQYERIQGFLEEHGRADKGIVRDFLSSDAATELAKGISGLIANLNRGGNLPLRSERTYVIKTEQGLIEMNPEQYREYLEVEGRKKLEAPKVETPPASVEAPPVPLGPETPSTASKLISADTLLKEMVKYAEYSPEGFIDDLLTRVAQGEETATLVIGVLSFTPVDDIMNQLSELRKVDEMQWMVEWLGENKEWLNNAITYLKEKTKAEE